MVFEPAAHVGDEGETGGVAFGETVFTEAFDLFEDAFGKLGRVTALNHAAHQPVVEFVDAAFAFPRGHGAP